MKCGACGTELEKDARFCHICGQPAPPSEPETSSLCPACGAKLPKIAVFCPQCGVALSEAAPRQTDTPAAVAAAPAAPPAAPSEAPERAAESPSAPKKRKKKKGSGVGMIVLMLLIVALIFGCVGAVLYVEADARGQTLTEYIAEAVGETEPETAKWSDLETPPEIGSETWSEEEPEAESDAGHEMNAKDGLLTQDVCQIYMELLQSRLAAIDGYDWQQLGSDLPNRPVVLCDICGDIKPELIWVEKTDEQNVSASTLNIAGIRDGAAVILCSQRWDVQAGGGFRYYLFQKGNDKTLYAFSSFGEETWMRRYAAYVEMDGGLVSSDVLTSMTTELLDGENTGEVSSYARMGEEISAEEWLEAVKELEAETDRILMYSADAGSFVSDFVSQNGCPAMTGGGSIAFLTDCIEALS